MLSSWQPRVLKELTKAVSEPSTIPFENSWKLDEVLDDYKRANFIFIFKKRKEEDPEDYRSVNLTSISGTSPQGIHLETPKGEQGDQE